jgi:glutamate formiminotransferase/formiminotetrahydrofolate cyclodeaminase
MPAPLVECIPNFSEARRPEVVESILQSIWGVPGVNILDRHSDLDHNRTVITFVGSPSAVEEAAFQAIHTAGRLIDLNNHQGEHPRIGATDVVPFVPLNDVTMEECVEIARHLGRRVADELGIPVYLYEEAATTPERQDLENIRRGQFETLKSEIETEPDRVPDFGPRKLGPAGATVIGARQPLIAFNVFLTTNDVTIAQKIARAIRNSSGGLHFVKAMGVLVEGRAQVSMNITNYRQSPLARVVEMIRLEAARYGTAIHHSELVGLIPQEALVDGAVWYLQLDEFQPEQILEQRLFEIQSKKPQHETTFLDRLASAKPTPGGGSATAYIGALAAALASKVARLTVGKKKYAAVEGQMWPLIERSEILRAELTNAVEQDAAAYEELLAARKLPKFTPEEQAIRTHTIEKATVQAALVPLEVARKSLSVIDLLLTVAELGNLAAISDVGVGINLARAAIDGAALNINTNLSNLQDQTSVLPIINEAKKIEQSALESETRYTEILKERSKLIV